MKASYLRKNLHELRRFTAALAAVLFTGTAATTWADALYIITGAQESAIVLEKGVQADVSSQLINVTSRTSGHEIYLAAGQTVTIRHDGAIMSVQAKQETVSSLLDRLHIDLSPIEMVAVDVANGVTITIASDITYYDTVVEEVAHPVVRVPNAQMAVGTEKVVQEGRDGVSTSVYEVVWSNGVQLSRQFVEELNTTVVSQIVEYGTSVETVSRDDALVNVTTNTDGSGTLHFASGATMCFSGVKDMTATAYTAGYDGVDTCTATGTTVRMGVVAVDKKVIPLGTKMYIVAKGGIVYGTAVAEDTGMRGNKLDLYYETYDECIQFGRRGCTVYILE
ncbi:MAG: G5 domain-containing protein [Oscillibacter sp.]|nr:G5 domain-containing protein [Oscillibacter sp.]